MNLPKRKTSTTSSQRQKCLLNKKNLKNLKKLKNKTFFFKNQAGRNNKGFLTIFTKGGGHKKNYRMISYKRAFLSGIVESIEYDPYRSANIARICSVISSSKVKVLPLTIHFYILAPEGLEQGHFIESFLNKTEFNYKIGNLFYLKDLPLGVFVHNVLFSSKKGGIARSAGCGAQIISKDNNFCRLRLNSGEHRLFPSLTEATLGILSNSLHKLVNLGKAGRARWVNKRPSVRGVAMNPVDHPHGGGEGKSSGGRPSVTPWGKVAKGQSTKNKNIKLIYG
jgi:large subunit ribosomal protein L2